MSRGGRRKGSGAKLKYPQGVRAKTFRLPIDICEFLESQETSATSYLVKLIENDKNASMR